MIQMQQMAATVALATLALAATAPAQGVGTRVPDAKLTGFTQIGASSNADLIGRTVLYEFFAYW